MIDKPQTPRYMRATNTTALMEVGRGQKIHGHFDCFALLQGHGL